MTNTYDTSKEPLGSTAVKVLYNNASNLDDAVNSDAETWVDRPPFGRERLTWRGMENIFSASQQDKEDRFQAFLLSSGYQYIGEYDSGPLTITAYNQVFLKDGNLWGAGAALALPYTTVNNWTTDQPKMVLRGDNVLRQDLANTTDLAKGAGQVGRAVVAVASIADLLLSPRTLAQHVSVRGYNSGTSFGGGLFYWNASSTATADSYLVFAVPGVTTGRWLRILSPDSTRTPEMAGAMGDGVTNDSIAVTKWWSTGGRLSARGTYSVTMADTGTEKVMGIGEDFFADLRGAEFKPTAIVRDLFRIVSNVAARDIHIVGGTLTCADRVARPLVISGSGTARSIVVGNHTITGTKENGQSYSTFGLFIPLECPFTILNGVRVDDVNRVTSGGGISCQGISVNNVTATCHIYDCVVRRVRTPDTVDADGIAVFTKNRLVVPSEIQPVDVRVYNNRLEDCQDRFIKFQGPGKAYTNDFRTSMPITASFRAVDAQFGGVDCYENEWRCANVTGGADATFFMYQGQGNSGSEENVGSCFRNKLYLARQIRYLAFAQITGGAHRIDVDSNVSKGAIVASHHEQLTRLLLPAAASITSVAMRVSGNVYEGGQGGLLILTGAGQTDSGINTKLKLDVYDNDPGAVGAGFIALQGLAIGYFGDFLLRDNGRHPNTTVINALGVDVNNLRPGNDFYYGSDGGAGGMANAASGFNRFVHVLTTNKGVVLESDSRQERATKKAGATQWYKLTGTAI